MNDRPQPADSPRRRFGVAALLAAAAPVAIALASPIQIWAQPGPAPADTTLIAQNCDLPAGALTPTKWPDCLGD